MVNTNLKLRFKPVSHSWVALHPKPKGVIQFIAGAFFGTFGPMLFYRHLLRSLFEQGYTIILLPFNFTFDHYVEAGFLMREQYEILPELIRMASVEGYDYEAYLDDKNFSWIGHSLGCKYISLLEGFTALPPEPQDREKFIRKLLSYTSNELQIESVVADINILVEELKRKIIEDQKLIDTYVGREIKINSVFIRGQVSILLAPDISDTASAIRPQFLADIIDNLGWGVKPTPEETKNLIKDSGLFNIMGLVCFKSDKIAKLTCEWFTDILKKPPQKFIGNLNGGHLKPLGIQLGNTVINLFDKHLIESVQDRNKGFEHHVIELLEELKKLSN
ncbi:DUF1350 family protein [Nostoc sp. UCD121]|uniref:DUF1350 family protein n=1 Tax=unclassified Nostoc TaxID=2593658 RepID=UPI0016252B96|nr:MULTISPECIES: DUF1350 family protein [unclassified Nostoc]MBC1223008.1 DUF1350 family protein [Nostoc sp. UCD120]MBC1274538.1 DUF1350 family protein [Nostoc sp. UCD121]MBC1294671.1 DUF1350 family protein [Nostoc sp. UCD122]